MHSKAHSFRELYDRVLDYTGLALYKDVLLPYLPTAQRAIAELAPYRRRNTSENPYLVKVEDLWQWYALNRVNDYLLLRFQMSEDYFASQEWLEFQYHTRYLKPLWKHKLSPSAVLTREEYRTFFETIGFEIASRPQFHPFYHEIVQVTEMADMECGEIEIEEVYWDNVMFGEMLFSRSGVHIWSHPDTISKAIAEESTLYFTNARYARAVNDLSHGGGHNSQWRTDFRRDYEEKTQFYFNVDGKFLLDERYAEHFQSQPFGIDDLTIEERIELLVHRHFATCPKSSENRFPYNDMYFMPKEP